MKVHQTAWGLLITVLLWLPASPLPAQRLQEIEERLKDPPPPRSGLIRAPFSDIWFPPHYFYRPVHCSRRVDRPPAADLEPAIFEQPFSLSGGFHYLYDTKGNLEGWRGEISVGTPFGKLSSDFTRFREELPPPGSRDYLNLYYADYRVGLYGPEWSLELGGGYTGIYRDENWHGGNFVVAMETRPLRYLAIDAEFRSSMIRGSHISDLKGGVSLAYHWGAVRLGWRYLNLEFGPRINGPEIGFTLRF